MRPAEIPNEAIIEAGQDLLTAGRNVTGFALRQRVGGGNPARLRQVWDNHIASKTATQTEPPAELPVEVAEQVAAVTKALTDRLSALAVELNDKAVKAAERRVAEVVRAAGEQRVQADRELADAAQMVEELDSTLEAAKAENGTLTQRLEESQATAQAQAVELAQLRERLAALEQSARAAADQHALELAQLAKAERARDEARAETAKIREDAAQLRGQIEGLTKALNAKAGK